MADPRSVNRSIHGFSMPGKQQRPAESAEASALRLLGRKDYSRSELRRKLTAKGFSAEEAEGVLRRFEARGFLNDRKLAERLADQYSREKLWGPQKVLQKLMQRGIPSPVAREVLNRTEEKGETPERLRVLLRKKLKGRDFFSLSLREKKRLANSLYQRGYRWEEIEGVLPETGGSLEE